MADYRQDLILDHFRDVFPSIRAILLVGSRAMGYAGQEFDVDLWLILGDGADRTAVHESVLLAGGEV